eukprot:TRINITY_DN16578_c0_g1_i1.p1 TRINITY_DN16578_c0_g1~~TRINITY_DN16578_c0_g1_i1.p1  ORF type:complete len:490 (+),score=101.31 TRINITY_DN16578_c0_g1_i1:272-1741(+)
MPRAFEANNLQNDPAVEGECTELLDQLQQAQEELEQEDEILRQAVEVTHLLQGESLALRNEIADAESELAQHARQARHSGRSSGSNASKSRLRVDGHGGQHRSSATGGGRHHGNDRCSTSVGSATRAFIRQSVVNVSRPGESDGEEDTADLETLQEEINALKDQGEVLQRTLARINGNFEQGETNGGGSDGDSSSGSGFGDGKFVSGLAGVRSSNGSDHSAEREHMNARDKARQMHRRAALLDHDIERQLSTAARQNSEYALAEHELREEILQMEQESSALCATIQQEIAETVLEHSFLEEEVEGIIKERQLAIERFECQELQFCAEAEEEENLEGEYQAESERLRYRLWQIMEGIPRRSAEFKLPPEGSHDMLEDLAFHPTSTIRNSFGDGDSADAVNLAKSSTIRFGSRHASCGGSFLEDSRQSDSGAGKLAFDFSLSSPWNEDTEGASESSARLRTVTEPHSIRSRARAALACIRLRSSRGEGAGV